MSLQEIKSETEFHETIEKNGNSLVLVVFSAKFANKESQQIKEALEELIKSAQPNSIIGFQVDSDNCDALVKKMSIQCIPSVLVFARSKQVDKIEGTDIVVLVNSIKESIIKNYPLVADIGSGETSSKASLENRLKQLINSSDLMIFMKGSRSTPRCGFSKQIILILDSVAANYETFDILTDEDVRQGLKTYSNWPTYPQVYFKGQLIGGLDIIKQLYDTGEFQKMIQS